MLYGQYYHQPFGMQEQLLDQNSIQGWKGNNQPYTKFLCTMKMICYGVSGSAFIDYRQFWETTCRCCVSFLAPGLVNCHALSGVYLRKPTKVYSCKINYIHKWVHKIPGMLGSLDVTKVHRKNCPTALKGQFWGQEKYFQLLWGLLLVWHASCGFPGSMNDINVWERSLLFESMINGKHDGIDHDFTLDGKVFLSYLSCS